MQNISQIMWYILIIAAVAVGSLIIAVWVTRGFSKRLREGGNSSEAFTLQDIRQLLAEGKITRVEYEGMRAALIGRVKSADKSDRGKAAEARPDVGDEGGLGASDDPGENPK